MSRYLTRDRVAVVVALAAPLALAAILVPFRASFPNTDAALAMLLVVVAVAAGGGGGGGERVRVGGDPGRRVGGGLVRLLPPPPLRTVHDHQADRHRDHDSAADHRHSGHRAGGLGTPPVHGREQTGRLPG